MIRIAEPLPDDDGPYEYRFAAEAMFEFTGNIADDDLRFEHRRHYDPTVGRWLSEEPIGFVECNVPCYVGNGPINAADPSQLGSFSDDRAIGDGR